MPTNRIEKRIARVRRADGFDALADRLNRLLMALRHGTKRSEAEKRAADELETMLAALRHFEAAGTSYELQAHYVTFLDIVQHHKLDHPATALALSKVAAEYGKRLTGLEFGARRAKQFTKKAAQEEWLATCYVDDSPSTESNSEAD
jgi:hypothetical protein